MIRCILLCMLFAVPVIARPFTPGSLPAKTKWFIHADLEEFKKTEMGRFALKQMEHFSKDLRPLELMLGLDLRQDLHAVTLFGSGLKEAEVVVMLHGKFDRKQITNLAETAKEHRAIQFRSQVIHGWEDKKGVHYGCLVKEHAILFSDGLQSLRGAINTLNNESAGLKEKAIYKKSTAGKRPFFLIGLIDFEALDDLNANASIIEKMKAVCITVGQFEKNLQGRLLIQPRDEKTGTQIHQIIKGMIALVEFASDEDDPELSDLNEMLKNLKVERMHPFIAMDLKIPAKAIVNSLQMKFELTNK